MEKAKLTVVQVDNMPDLNTLIPTAVYYVRNEGVIIETNKNAEPKFFGGLASSYPDANTPLADDDKFIVRQGSEYKEVSKSDVAEKQQYVFDYGGFVQAEKGKYTVLAHSSSGIRGSYKKTTENTPLDVLMETNTRGWIIPKDGMKITLMEGYVHYAYGRDVIFYIGAKKYNDNGGIESVDIIHEFPLIKLNHYKRWSYDLDIQLGNRKGQDLVFFLKDASDLDAGWLYQFLNLIHLQ